MSTSLAEEYTAAEHKDPHSVCPYRFDPLKDSRWEQFLATHPAASVFHSTAWLTALRLTYGYDAVVFTTTATHDPLQNGMLFCQVESWLTGRRLVSVPFADHCEPLVDQEQDVEIFHAALHNELNLGEWQYVEIRPLQPVQNAMVHCRPSTEYAFHQLDIKSDLEKVFSRFHKDSVQRKIRRAEKENPIIEEGEALR